MAWRDARSQRGRLMLFALSLAVGLASLVAIHSLKSTLESAIDTESKALLGSDLQIVSRAPFDPALEAKLVQDGASVSAETSFPSLLQFPSKQASRMVQVRAIVGGYPFYGDVATLPTGAWSRPLPAGGMLLDPALLDQYDLKPGDTVRLGKAEFTVTAAVTRAPPRSGRFAGFAPCVYLDLAELGRTGLLGSGSLATHHLHVLLPQGAEAGTSADSLEKDWEARLKRDFPGNTWKVETPAEKSDQLGDSLDNMQHFLGIIAMAALILGAIGVAGAVHAHIVRRRTSIAILRCLGCPPKSVLGIYLGQTLGLGIGGAALGTGTGVLLHSIVLWLFRSDLPIRVASAPPWLTIAQAAGTGFLVCAAFALLPLQAVLRIPPAATLRNLPDGISRRTLTPTNIGLAMTLAVALFGLARLNTPDLKQALMLMGGLAVALGVLALVARLLVNLTRRFVRPALPYLLRQGLSNLHRPNNQTGLFLFSLGLGTFLLLTVLLARNLILGRLQVAESKDGPNVYLVDVQPDQIEGVTEILRETSLPALQSAPMISMRISALRGVPITQLRKEGSEPEWPLRREYRSTYRDHLTSTEKLLEGEFPAPYSPGDPFPVSLEKDIAKELQLSLGDTLDLDVQGVPIKARVASIREVDWSQFSLNFFMVFPPEALENAPGFRVITTRVPDEGSSGPLQRRLAQDFPTVTAIDLTVLLSTIRSIVDRISRVVQILGGFTVASGILVLAGTLLNGRDHRIRETALLRTLGASRNQVHRILLSEYAALGFLSTLTGSLLAVCANAALALTVFKASPLPDGWLIVGTCAAGTALAITIGVLVGRGVCDHPPLTQLRTIA